MNVLIRILLALCGLAILALGLNVSLGGMATLGWQGPTDFFSITRPDVFASQDNHIRFVAGVWAGVGALFLLGAFFLDRMRSVLIACIFLIVIGALGRIGSGNWDVLTSGDILPSLLAELLLFPVIGVWIMRSGQRANV